MGLSRATCGLFGNRATGNALASAVARAESPDWSTARIRSTIASWPTLPRENFPAEYTHRCR